MLDSEAGFFDRAASAAFVVRGVNYVYVALPNGGMDTQLLKEGLYDPARTRADFVRLADLGYNTVRVFLDHCSRGSGCIGDADNMGLNPSYLDNIADMMAAAREAGLALLFTSNDLPDQGGYAEEASAQAGETFAGYRNSYYLTPGAIRATRRYWRDLLMGLIERHAAFDAVLAWELLNEQWMFSDQPPLSLTSGRVQTTTGSYDMADPEQKKAMVRDGIRYYIAEIKDEILAHDPTALVTMGFFVPELVAPDWYVETAPLLADSELDFFDFHAYPGPLSLADHAEAFGMVGYQAKPIVMGEYGAFRSRYDSVEAAARALAQWTTDSCGLGFDGWLYWTYYAAAPGVGDRTWGLTDQDGFLLDLLAPVNGPDPCRPIEVPTANLAYSKPVTASAEHLEEPARNAVDEDLATSWNAGGDPPQWIEIDLQGSVRVREIRLLVAQYPDGPTIHRILVRTSVGGGFTTVHEFSGATQAGEWLVFQPAVPIEGVRSVRIQSVASPSWVAWSEIEVLGDTTGS